MEKNKGGRPTKYKKEFNDLAYKFSLLGATDKEMASFFEINVSNFQDWKHKHLKFRDSIRNGKEKADAIIAEKLYDRAIGYDYEEEMVTNRGEVVSVKKHEPPNQRSIEFWLKNRKPKIWRDRKELDHTSGGEKIIVIPPVVMPNNKTHEDE